MRYCPEYQNPVNLSYLLTLPLPDHNLRIILVGPMLQYEGGVLTIRKFSDVFVLWFRPGGLPEMYTDLPYPIVLHTDFYVVLAVCDGRKLAFGAQLSTKE